MLRGSGRWLPILLLLAVAGLSFWLERAVEKQQPGAAPNRNAPDFWAEDFSVRSFDVQGRMHYVIHAARMTHYADRDAVEVDSPDILFSADGTTRVTAAHALVGPDSKRIDFSGRVRVERSAARSAGQTVLMTEQLTLLPDTGEASGPAAVSISQPGAEISGHGFVTNHTTGQSTLGGRVHALVQPRS